MLGVCFEEYVRIFIYPWGIEGDAAVGSGVLV
jgi:hypothetical protein